MILFDSYGVTHDELQILFLPIRFYYRFSRWIYGQHYNPFATNVKEGRHPIISLFVAYQKSIRTFLKSIPSILLALKCLFMALIIQKLTKKRILTSWRNSQKWTELFDFFCMMHEKLILEINSSSSKWNFLFDQIRATSSLHLKR